MLKTFWTEHFRYHFVLLKVHSECFLSLKWLGFFYSFDGVELFVTHLALIMSENELSWG